jgi:hypothetical protein
MNTILFGGPLNEKLVVLERDAGAIGFPETVVDEETFKEKGVMLQTTVMHRYEARSIIPPESGGSWRVFVHNCEGKDGCRYFDIDVPLMQSVCHDLVAKMKEAFYQ